MGGADDAEAAVIRPVLSVQLRQGGGDEGLPELHLAVLERLLPLDEANGAFIDAETFWAWIARFGGCLHEIEVIELMRAGGRRKRIGKSRSNSRLSSVTPAQQTVSSCALLESTDFSEGFAPGPGSNSGAEGVVARRAGYRAIFTDQGLGAFSPASPRLSGA